MFLEHYTGIGFCLLDKPGGTVLYRNVGAENIVTLADVSREAAEDAMRAARRCTRIERAKDLNADE